MSSNINTQINKKIVSESNAPPYKPDRNRFKIIRDNYQLYLLLLPAIIYFIVFRYIPMAGIQIAFKNYTASKGIWGSPWIGFEHFIRYFTTPDFLLTIENTLGISIFSLVVGFPLPIILALLLNQMYSKKYRKVVQTVVYAPQFISVIVVVGMLSVFLSPRSGIINIIMVHLGFKPVFFLGIPKYFKPIYIISGLWQSTGWNSVIYIAALAGINPELYESAVVDGASKLQRLLHIDIPGIMPTAIIMLILNSGNILSVGFEKAFLMQNSLNRMSSEVIQTYVYKQGLIQGDFSYATAIGVFNAIVNLTILLIVNKLAKKYSQTSLL